MMEKEKMLEQLLELTRAKIADMEEIDEVKFTKCRIGIAKPLEGYKKGFGRHEKIINIEDLEQEYTRLFAMNLIPDVDVSLAIERVLI